MSFALRRLGKLCTALAVLTLLSGCAEVISFTAGFGAGFFTGKYYAEGEAEDRATMKTAMARQQQQTMMGGQSGPAQDYAYAPQQQQAPLPYNDPYYGMAPSGYPGGYAAPAPAYPAYPPAAPAPAYGAPAYGYGTPAPGSVYVPPPIQPAPSAYVTPTYGYDQSYRYQPYSY